MSREIHNPLILLEASTGIEPVYTDLQSAASPLRQLASERSAWVSRSRGGLQAARRISATLAGLFRRAVCREGRNRCPTVGDVSKLRQINSEQARIA